MCTERTARITASLLWNKRGDGATRATTVWNKKELGVRASGGTVVWDAKVKSGPREHFFWDEELKKHVYQPGYQPEGCLPEAIYASVIRIIESCIQDGGNFCGTIYAIIRENEIVTLGHRACETREEDNFGASKKFVWEIPPTTRSRRPATDDQKQASGCGMKRCRGQCVECGVFLVECSTRERDEAVKDLLRSFDADQTNEDAGSAKKKNKKEERSGAADQAPSKDALRNTDFALWISAIKDLVAPSLDGAHNAYVQ